MCRNQHTIFLPFRGIKDDFLIPNLSSGLASFASSTQAPKLKAIWRHFEANVTAVVNRGCTLPRSTPNVGHLNDSLFVLTTLHIT